MCFPCSCAQICSAAGATAYILSVLIASVYQSSRDTSGFVCDDVSKGLRASEKARPYFTYAALVVDATYGIWGGRFSWWVREGRESTESVVEGVSSEKCTVNRTRAKTKVAFFVQIIF